MTQLTAVANPSTQTPRVITSIRTRRIPRPLPNSKPAGRSLQQFTCFWDDRFCFQLSKCFGIGWVLSTSAWKWHHLNGCCPVMLSSLLLISLNYSRSAYFLQHNLYLSCARNTHAYQASNVESCSSRFTNCPWSSSQRMPPKRWMNQRSCEMASTGPGKLRMAVSKASSTSRLI
jgi:hypothetical protein